MIKELQGHITDEQIDKIVEIIILQYKDYLNLINSTALKQLFAEEYAPHKKQHTVSWAISSAFPSNTTIANNLQISRLQYGKGHTRPLLSNDFIEMHILNTTSDFAANYLDKFYQKNNNHFSNQTLYCYIKFKVKNKQLVNISLCLPNEKGEVVHEEVLFDNNAIIKKVA